MKTTRLSAVVAFLFALSLPVFAQQGEHESSLAEIDAACVKIASEIEQAVKKAAASRTGKPAVAVDSFYYDWDETQLGNLVAMNIKNALAQSSSILTRRDYDDQTEFLVSGDIVIAGSILRINIQLTKEADGSLVWGKNVDFQRNDLIDSMLQGDSYGYEVSEDDYEWEYDSMENAYPLEPFDSSPELTLHEDDEDWFSVTVSEASLLTVYTSGDLDTYMEAYIDTFSPRILGSNDDGYDDEDEDYNARIEIFAEADKTYYFKVTAYEGDTGYYGIHAETESVTDFGEPNDTRAKAVKLGLNAELDALFSRNDDVDWYQIDVGSGGGLLQARTSGNLDTVIDIYDDKGTLLLSADDYGEDLNARARVRVKAGKYFAKVTELDGNTGRYGIHARVGSTATDDRFEPDDASEAASSITVNGSAQERTFTDPWDEDWVRFRTANAGSYVITVDTNSGSGNDSWVTLYNEEMESQVEEYYSGSVTVIEIDLAAGNWFLRIMSQDMEEGAKGNYRLTVNGKK